MLTTTQIQTPIGTMIAGAKDEGICMLEFADMENRVRSHTAELQQLLNTGIKEGENEHLQTLQQQLEEFFQKERKSFDLPLITPGTPFQQEVWNSLQNIPFGQTISYKAQATAMNKLDAIRAIASTNGANRISIIIPCHRVIGSNGKLTGYGGGLWRKRWLLDFEQGNLFS